jgi:hypothetical protein
VTPRAALLAAAGVLIAVVAAVLIARSGGGGPAAKGPALPAERVTIVQDDAEFLHRPTARVRDDAGRLRDLGVDWLRVTASWSAIAPDAASPRRPDFDATDPAAYPPGAWAGLDRAFAEARRAGLRVMIDIAFFAPRWAVSRPSGEPGREVYGVDPAAYGDFAEAVARRYSGAAAFAVWNEPNFRVFLMPQHVRRGGRWVAAAPHLYRAMLYAAAPRIRAAAPQALLLIGNTAAAGTDDASAESDGVPPMTFVRELACVDARLQPLDRPECKGFHPLPGDGFAHHPYTQNTVPGTADPDPQHVRVEGLGRLDALLGRLHDAGRTERRLALFVTEYGYETDPPDPRQPWTLADQVNLLAEAELLANRVDPGLRGWAQFLLRDLGPRPGPAAQRWSDFQSGLLLPDGTPKPAYDAFRLPLVVRPAPGGGLRVEGRVRPREDRGEVTIEGRLASGRWAPAAGARPIRADADGFFAAVVRPSAITGLRARAGRLTSRALDLAAD